jgi:tetratricopeptide (TPR) repeat protein
MGHRRRTKPVRPPNSSDAGRGRFVVGVLLILAATLVAYHPAWHGGMVWDDDAHLTPAGLRGLGGIWLIWFQLGATQQYYPVTHSAFWVLGRVAEGTAPYHLTNIVLHVATAVGVAAVMGQLRIRGGLFAAAIFALHPMQVESVAWISELKNVLSGVFYVAAFATYLRWRELGGKHRYALAFSLFLLGVLSKSVTATLPAALLLATWWQHRQLGWRRELVPLLPFGGTGLTAGLASAWIERTYIGAQGQLHSLSVGDRVLIAGRAPWSYFERTLLPLQLSFNYPRWQLDPGDVTQWAFVAMTLVTLAAAACLVPRTRTPMVAVLFFLVTLSPALGFVNVYPFRYSFVADHFAYLAILGIIIPLVAVADALTVALFPRALRRTCASALILVLVTLTWRSSARFADAATLYRATLQTNPTSWFAHSNLGALLLSSDGGHPSEAIPHFIEALRLKPDLVEARYNLGVALQRTGDDAGAARELEMVLQLNPDHPKASLNLAEALRAVGRLHEAESTLRNTLSLSESAATRNNLGMILAQRGNTEEAITEFRRALVLAPDLTGGRTNLSLALNARGVALAQAGKDELALKAYNEALNVDPTLVPALVNKGLSLAALGRDSEAIAVLEQAVRLEPADGESHLNAALLLMKHGRRSEAQSHLDAAIKVDPANERARQLRAHLR